MFQVNYFSKIMNFIIYLEIGIIAISQSPFKIKDAIDAIDKSKFVFPTLTDDYNQVFDSIWNMLSENGVYIDFDALIKSSTQGVLKNHFRTIMYRLVYGLDYFFNNYENKAFIICLEKCALKVGETAGEAAGWIIDLLLRSINKSIAQRPNLNHFLTYGINPYKLISQIQTEIYSILGFHSEIHFNSSKVGVWSGGKWYGVVNENGEKLDWQDALTLGFHRGDNEEDDVLKVLSDLQNFGIKASETTARTYRRGYISSNTIFETENYQKMIQLWDETNSTINYDLEGIGRFARLAGLQLHSHFTDTKTLELQRIKIQSFYDTYNKSGNPVAERICTEIEERLIINGTLMGARRPGYMEVQVLTIAPVVLYAIIEFEQMQKMTSLMYQQNAFRMQSLYEMLSNSRETEALNELRDTIRLYENGAYDTKTLLEKLNENLNLYKDRYYQFEVLRRRLHPDIVFTSFNHLPYMINSIVRGFNHVNTFNSMIEWINADESVLKFMGGIGTTMYHISPSEFNSTHEYERDLLSEEDRFYRGIDYRPNTIVEQDGVNYDGNEERNRYTWKSNEYILNSINRGHLEKKLQIRQLLNQRCILWGIINTLVKSLSHNVLYEGIELNNTNG